MLLRARRISMLFFNPVSTHCWSVNPAVGCPAACRVHRNATSKTVNVLNGFMRLSLVDLRDFRQAAVVILGLKRRGKVKVSFSACIGRIAVSPPSALRAGCEADFYANGVS